LASSTKSNKSNVPVVSDCNTQPSIFKVAKTNIVPNAIEKGTQIKMKVIGAMMQEVNVDKVHLEVYLNTNIFFQQDLDKKGSVKKGLYSYDFEVSIPTFAPDGAFMTKFILMSDKNEVLACTQMNFDIY